MTTTTKESKATALQTQILGINTLYKHSKEIIAKEINFLSALVGKKVLKADNSFMAKYEHDKLSYKYKISAYGFDFWADTHYYFYVDYGKISIKVITTVSGGGYDKNGVNCNHSQNTQSFDLFKIDADGKIIEPCEDDRDFLNTEYKEADILQAAENVKKAAKEYDAVFTSVPYMFRDTLYLQRLR